MEKFLFLPISLMLFLGACASYVPDEEMVLAETAIQAALDAGAHQKAPVYFQRAQTAMRQAQHAYHEKEFDRAKHYALEAKTLAERAENKAVLNQESE